MTDMVKVVYNGCYGGFGLSKAGWARYKELGGTAKDIWELRTDERRKDPVLVQVVEELGKDANAEYAELCIAVLPKGVFYRIDEYDGNESVMERSDYDWTKA